MGGGGGGLVHLHLIGKEGRNVILSKNDFLTEMKKVEIMYQKLNSKL